MLFKKRRKSCSNDVIIKYKLPRDMIMEVYNRLKASCFSCFPSDQNIL